jgi:hypothetical protein
MAVGDMKGITVRRAIMVELEGAEFQDSAPQKKTDRRRACDAPKTFGPTPREYFVICDLVIS